MTRRLVAMGVDGAPAGWVAACLWRDGSDEQTDLHLITTIDEIAALREDGTKVAIDMPIGLPEIGTPKQSEIEARARLRRGGRAGGSSVFPSPARWMLAFADDYDGLRAEAAHRQVTEPSTKSLSKQAWAILPKIAALDAWIDAHTGVDEWLVECHPEVCFAALAGGTPPADGKKTAAGRAARRELIRRVFPDAPAVLDAWPRPHKRAAPDDLLDAYAALHAAVAWHDGTHEFLGDGATDERRRPMRMLVGPTLPRRADSVVTLRPTATADDIAFCVRVERDPAAQPFVSNSTAAQHRARIDGPGEHLIIESDGERAGFMILGALDEHRTIELGRLVVAGRGRGVGRQALALAIDRVFGTTAAHRFWLDVLPRNERARRAYRRAGFVDEGALRDAWISPTGNVETLQIMSILRPEWEARQASGEGLPPVR